MEYFIGAIIFGVICFGFIVKGKVDKFNKQTRLKFSDWLALYKLSEPHEQQGMARAITLQTFHLAEVLRVLSPAEKTELETASKKEDPIAMFTGWADTVMPTIIDICGEEEALSLEARLVGVLMLVGLKGVNPDRDIRDFLQATNTPLV